MQHSTGGAQHMPIHSTQPPQPITSGQPYHQPLPYYPPLPPQPYPPTPPVPTNTGATPGALVAGGVGQITTGVTGDNNAMGGSNVAGGGGSGADQLVQQDIERGLRIDFYSETDPMLLASWASFFRDQFIEARQELAKASYDRNAETYRRATHFVERVETKILKTNAMKQLFRRHPLTHINDPVRIFTILIFSSKFCCNLVGLTCFAASSRSPLLFLSFSLNIHQIMEQIFVDACYRVIIDYLMRNPPFDGFAFGNPTWRDYMWFRAGLMKVVEEGRNEFLEWYTKKIWETLGELSL
jgi:hypothetical protein